MFSRCFLLNSNQNSETVNYAPINSLICDLTVHKWSNDHFPWRINVKDKNDWLLVFSLNLFNFSIHTCIQVITLNISRIGTKEFTYCVPLPLTTSIWRVMRRKAIGYTCIATLSSVERNVQYADSLAPDQPAQTLCVTNRNCKCRCN